MKLIKELFLKYFDIIKYLVFGVLTTVLNVITYHIFYELCKFGNITSTIIAWVVAVAFAFITNKLFVFNSKKWDENSVKEVVEFFLCRIGTGIIEIGMMYLCVDIFAFNGTVMKLITNIIVIIINYFASKFLVFKK